MESEEEKEGYEASCSSRGRGRSSGGRSAGAGRKGMRARTLLLGICVIVFLGAVGFFDSSLAKLVTYNRADLLILGCEMLTEAGPRFSARRHRDILQKYKAQMKLRRFAGVLAWFPLYKKYSPEKGIDAALDTLGSVENETDLQKIAVAIWRAGEQLMQFRGETTHLFRRIGWYKPRELPQQFMKELDKAYEASTTAWTEFSKHKTLLGAWRLCEQNRRTMLYLFQARSEGQCKEEIERSFKLIAKNSAEAKSQWADKTFEEGSSKWELVHMFADSEDRRYNIVEAMQDNQMDKAHELMWEAIEKAIQKRERVLEIALELQHETQNWEQRVASMKE